MENEHIVIGVDRKIDVPKSLRRIAVQYDHNVKTVTFDCPRKFDNVDLSEMDIYINYMRSDGVMGSYLVDNVRIDETNENIIHFDWTISVHVSEAKGSLYFIVCARKTDDNGAIESHWNSETNKQMIVSEGLECQETILESNPDLVGQLQTIIRELENGNEVAF